MTNIYDKKKYYLSLAGSGDPWSVLTKVRGNLLKALHDIQTIDKLSKIFDMSEEEILVELQPMIEASLVNEENNHYRPTFFISNLDETNKVVNHTKKTGKILANTIFSRWEDIETSYNQLSISKNYLFENQAFMLVGSRILDIGLLEALSRDESLMTSAPSRPSPNKPDAKYYFYMVEGKLEHLGKYGQDDIKLPNTDWLLLNFGQGWIDNKSNDERDNFEKRCNELINSEKSQNPQKLAKQLEIPFMDEKDSRMWAETVKNYATILMKMLKDNKENLLEFYQTLGSSKYSHNSFGEFICWYVHLAYAWAIDFLAEKKVISIPSNYFSAIILHQKGSEGLLVNK
ncbi:MAG: hypothetical protein ACXAC7_08380 [Candidatus Hodarchaeales archaeon]